MRYHHKKSLVIFFFFLTLGFHPAALRAYVLPGPYLLKLMTQNLGDAKRLMVIQKLVLHDDTLKKSGVELSETLTFIFPNIFRSDILSENIQRIHILSKNEALTVMDKKISDEPESRYDLYKDLLLFRSREILQKRLSHLGVNTNISSLGRFQGKPSYVLGAQYPDETAHQIWLDKNTFLPFRWIMTTSANQHLEVVYLDWKKLGHSWYPMRIEIFSNGALVREIYVQDIKEDPSFPADFFDIRKLKLQYPRRASDEQENEAKEDLDEVQKTIEEFKKIYK